MKQTNEIILLRMITRVLAVGIFAGRTGAGLLLACLATAGLLAACADAAEEDAPTPVVAIEEAIGTMTQSDVPLTRERIHEVRLKYDDLFWRQPNVWGVGEGLLYDENDEPTETIGITVKVSSKVDQNTLPIADRIPAFLEGVPVQIQERNVPRFLPIPAPAQDSPNENTND